MYRNSERINTGGPTTRIAYRVRIHANFLAGCRNLPANPVPRRSFMGSVKIIFDACGRMYVCEKSLGTRVVRMEVVGMIDIGNRGIKSC